MNTGATKTNIYLFLFVDFVKELILFLHSNHKQVSSFDTSTIIPFCFAFVHFDFCSLCLEKIWQFIICPHWTKNYQLTAHHITKPCLSLLNFNHFCLLCKIPSISNTNFQQIHFYIWSAFAVYRQLQ